MKRLKGSAKECKLPPDNHRESLNYCKSGNEHRSVFQKALCGNGWQYWLEVAPPASCSAGWIGCGSILLMALRYLP